MKIANLQELIGRRVVVTADSTTAGYLINRIYLDARKLGATGTVTGAVPGHGGDVVWVLHDGAPEGQEIVAAYCHLDELEFYSGAAVAFATNKERQLEALKQEREQLNSPVAALDAKMAKLRAAPLVDARTEETLRTAVDRLVAEVIASRTRMPRNEMMNQLHTRAGEGTSGRDLERQRTMWLAKALGADAEETAEILRILEG